MFAGQDELQAVGFFDGGDFGLADEFHIGSLGHFSRRWFGLSALDSRLATLPGPMAQAGMVCAFGAWVLGFAGVFGVLLRLLESLGSRFARILSHISEARCGAPSLWVELAVVDF